MAKILIVEDEELINDLVKENLKLVGHTCEQAYDREEAAKKMEQNTYDLIILDVMLPKISGFNLIEKRGKSPVIMLTAKANVLDRVKGLNLGAEDYIVKPFDMLELVARVNVVLRRNKKSERVFTYNSLEVDMDSKIVRLDDETVELTPKEYELLEVLINNKKYCIIQRKTDRTGMGL